MERLCGSDELIEANLTDTDWSIYFDKDRGRYQVKCGKVESPTTALGTLELAIASVVYYLGAQAKVHQTATKEAKAGIERAEAYLNANRK